MSLFSAICLLVCQTSALFIAGLLYNLLKHIGKNESLRHTNNMELLNAVEKLLEKKKREEGAVEKKSEEKVFEKKFIPKKNYLSKARERAAKANSIRLKAYWKGKSQEERTHAMAKAKEKRTAEPPAIPIKIVD